MSGGQDSASGVDQDSAYYNLGRAVHATFGGRPLHARSRAGEAWNFQVGFTVDVVVVSALAAFLTVCTSITAISFLHMYRVGTTSVGQTRRWRELL